MLYVKQRKRTPNIQPVYCNIELFLNKQKDHHICFLKFKLKNLALVGGVFQQWITFSQCSGLLCRNLDFLY